MKKNNSWAIKILRTIGAILVTLGWIFIFISIARWVRRQEDPLMVACFLIALALPLYSIIIFIVLASYVPFMGKVSSSSICPMCGSDSYREEWGANYGTVGYSYLRGKACSKCGYKSKGFRE